MAKKSPKSKSYSTPLAPWVAGAHRRLISEAEAEAYGSPYQAFEGERLAGFTPEEQAGFQARQDMYEGGDPYADWAGQALEYGSQLPGQLGDISSGYNSREFNFGNFDQGATENYMSPYMENVTAYEKDAARDEFSRQNMQSDAQRVASGSRGGYREALANYFGGAEEARAIGEIEARGRQSAFENAQQQFERDRNAAYQSATFGDQSDYRASQMGMKADLANQQRVMDQSRLARDYATSAMNFGTAGQQREMARIQAMEQAGATQRQWEQQLLNMQIADFDRQQAYPWTQMNRLQGIIAGTPSNIAGMETSQAAPSFLNQALGAGLGAAGIMNLLDG